MAELATPSAAQVATADATAPQEKQQNARPEKPDEDKYKEDLAKAEKEHQAAQEKLVCDCILKLSLSRSHMPVAASRSMPTSTCDACAPSDLELLPNIIPECR